MRRRPPNRSSGAGTFFSPTPPRIFAHRGLALEAPENTLLAFLAALSLGLDYLEIDVQVSHDGVAVVAHDPDLSRVAGRSIRIDQLTLAELKRIDLGNGQTFSSLAEVLDAFPEARFNLDIKCAGAVGPTVDAILDAQAVRRVLIASFDDRRRLAAVSLLPGVATSASRGSTVTALLAGLLGLKPLVRSALRNVDAMQIPEQIAGMRIVTPRMVRMLHDAEVEVHVWTVNDVATMKRLLAIGVDGIVTDRADLAVGLRA